MTEAIAIDTSSLRTTCAILYAAARYVPVPFLDDLLREQITAYLVKRTLTDQNRRLAPHTMRPLYASDSGCLHGCLAQAFWIPIKLLLFPIRKVLNILLSARWVTRDIAETLLFARALDHGIAADLLRDGADDDAQLARSRELRQAFDVALKGTDTHLLTSLLAAGLGPLRGMITSALRSLRSMRQKKSVEPDVEQTPELADRRARIAAVLARPEVVAFLREFDTRFRENLAVLAARREGTAPAPRG